MRPLLLFLFLAFNLSGAALAAATVTVKPGDTLYGIAHAGGLSVAQLQAINGLKDSQIRVGQVLKLTGSAVVKPVAIKPASKTPSRTTSSSSSTYTIKSGDNLGKIARQHGTSVAHLQAINGLKDSQIHVGEVLKLTGSAVVKPVTSKPAVKTPSRTTSSSSSTYTVKSGDSLGKIARQHGTSVAHLQAINGLKDSQIHVGEVLKLTGSAVVKPVTIKPVVKTPTRTASNSSSTYTVKSGDSLGKIARQHSTSVAHLQALNGLKDSQIRVGQVLKLTGSATIKPPAKTPTRTASNSGSTYTVKSGDSLGKIAAQYGVSIGAVQQANGLSGSVIQVGQRLKIPARGTRVAAVASVPAGMERRTVYGYERVRVSDTPTSFAARYGLSAEQVRRLSGLGSTRQITPGSRLLVPQKVLVPMAARPHRAAVTYRSASVAGVTVHVVSVDLRHSDVLVSPVLPGRTATFDRGASVRALTASSGARALINGSYFHPQSYAPAGDIVMQGRLLTWGRLPAALAITPDNRASIRSNTTALFGRPLESSWEGMETVIASGPRILAGGGVVSSYGRVFQDPAVFGEAARSAIGLSSSRDLLLVSTHARLSVAQMARVMQALGARDALLLDGGSSAGLSYNGSVLLDSVRRVSYGIGVFSGYTGRRYMR